MKGISTLTRGKMLIAHICPQNLHGELLSPTAEQDKQYAYKVHADIGHSLPHPKRGESKLSLVTPSFDWSNLCPFMGLVQLTMVQIRPLNLVKDARCGVGPSTESIEGGLNSGSFYSPVSRPLRSFPESQCTYPFQILSILNFSHLQFIPPYFCIVESTQDYLTSSTPSNGHGGLVGAVKLLSLCSALDTLGSNKKASPALCDFETHQLITKHVSFLSSKIFRR